MAQVDVRWPSEDEDFDATIAKASAQTAKPVSVVNKTEPEDGMDNNDNKSESKILPKESDSEPEAYKKESDPEAEPDSTAKETPDADPEPVASDSVDEKPAAAATLTAPAALVEDKPVEPTRTTIMSSKRPGPVARLVLEAVLFIALVVLGLWAWTLNSDNNNLKQQVAQLNANPQITIQKQTDELIAKVGKLIDLPAGETPTIANVSDAEAARKQSSFFNNAQNGDRVLMYVKAGEAVLYRPSTNKIILVAPLTFNNSASSTTAPATSTKTSR